MRFSLPSCLTALLLFALAGKAEATNVTVETQLGTFELELFDEQAPVTVENFLNYVRDGDYVDSVIHRSVVSPVDFVIQGGAYRIVDDQVSSIPTDDPIVNEPGILNTRGTIAMAKLSGDPNSATSSWFINLVDNPDLDTQNGGFTVFGRVVGNGMAVVDAIADLPVRSLGVSGFTSTPLYDWSNGEVVGVENFVKTNFTVQSDTPTGIQINPGLNDAWYDRATAGQGIFFTVYADLGLISLAWFTYDTERPDESATAIIGEAGHRWVTALGPIDGSRSVMDATLTTGGIFDDPAEVENDLDYGTIVVEFPDCDTVELSYDFPGPGLSGDITLERVVKENVALCEALQEEPAPAQ